MNALLPQIVPDQIVVNVALSDGPVTNTRLAPRRMTFEDFATLLSSPSVGTKDGSYYVRGGNLSEPKRGDEYLQSADLLILDGDGRIDPSTGEVIAGAPPFEDATAVLDELGLAYVAHTSHSHVEGAVEKWRIAIPALIPNKTALTACVGHIASKLHSAGVLIDVVKEMTAWSQAWYLPRVRNPDELENFKYRANPSGRAYPVGEAIQWYVTNEDDLMAPPAAAGEGPYKNETLTPSAAAPSIIQKFNADHGLDWVKAELAARGYKFSHYVGSRNEWRYIAPGSSSGLAGVRVFPGKRGDWCVCSHHGAHDPLAGKSWVDPFGLFALFHHGDDLKRAAQSLIEVTPIFTAPTKTAVVANAEAKPRPKREPLETVSFADLIFDQEPEEPDYIEPNFLGPGNFALIAGPPKAQKSFLLTELLVACATGGTFLSGTFRASKPLKVFYLQAEMNRKLLKKRAQMMNFLAPSAVELVRRNLVVTARFTMLLNEDGVETVVDAIKAAFPDGPDIIAIDPLANVYDGESEDKAGDIMAFLTRRVEALRRAVNPRAAVIMVHHSTKKTHEDMARDPFVAIRGSGALRGYYDTGVIIFRKSEESTERRVHFELRNGESPEPLTVKLNERGVFDVQDNTPQGVSPSMAQAVLNEITAAWRAGKPLSNSKQTKGEGRHIGRRMAAVHGMSSDAVDALVQQWLDNGTVSVEVFDKKAKLKGLKVTGVINAAVG